MYSQGGGIICYRYKKSIDDYEFLVVCKSCTPTFVNIITARYNLNLDTLLPMTELEKYMLSIYDIEDLYKQYFCVKDMTKDIELFIKIIKDRYVLSKMYIDKKANITDNRLFYDLPKGKANNNESILSCALREFKEETSLSDIKLNYNTDDMNDYIKYDRYWTKKEIIKYGKKQYHIIYYVAQYMDDSNNFIYNKDSDIIFSQWATIDELDKIRMDYMKKKLIYEVYRELYSKS